MWDRCTEWLRCGPEWRLASTLVALLFGLGILVLVVGLLADAYSWRMGIIGLVALWGVAFVLRVFLVTPEK